MTVFINAIYGDMVGIVRIIPQGSEIRKEDYHNNVKSFFKIQNPISFYDQTTKCIITDDILVEYIGQYRSSAGWSLGVVDVTATGVKGLIIPIADEDLIDHTVEEEVIDRTIKEVPIDDDISCARLDPILEDIDSFLGADNNQEDSTEVADVVDGLATENFNYPLQIVFGQINAHNQVELPPQPSVTLILSVEKLKNLSDLEFRIISEVYKTSKTFTNGDRVKLSKIIIKRLLESDHTLELTRQDFIYLANIIRETFTTEDREQYYTCAVYGQKPSGKLYDAYSNFRKQLRTVGLVKGRLYTVKTKATIQTDSDVIDTPTCLDLQFVKTSVEPFDILLTKWQNCFAERRKIINKKETTTFEYLNLFPIFKSNNTSILQLFTDDARTVYPDIRSIHVTWSILYKRILTKATTIKDQKVRQWIRIAEENCSEVIRKAIAFLILPYFFPATNIKKKIIGKSSYKVSKIEVQEKFVAHFNTLQEADNYEKELIQDSAGLQPRIIFVGDFKFLQAYVTLVDNKYFFENPVDAVEQIFNIYSALNISYPAEAIIVWNFMQQYIFNVKTEYDVNKPSIRAVYKLLFES